MLTSGTTGRSKGVVHPHLMPLVAARECAAQMATTADERLYTCLPLFHGAAQINISLHAFYAGATVVLGRRFSASRFWDELRTHRVTQFNALGSVLPMLLAQPPSDRDRDHRATKVFAAPAPPQVLHPFEERFGVHVVEGYGLTEIKNVLYNPLDARKVGSLGLPTASSVLEIHDESGQRAAPGRAGEIVYRPRLPDIMFSGYHRDPEATLATMKDLWWHTGDLGHTDEDGYFYFIDRKKDALRRRGENISSHEIESVLLACPGVLAAAAIGTPSELGEDEVLVAVQPEPGHELDLTELFAHCDRSMPHFMVPRYYRVVDRLPVTPNGKVRKHQLRDQGRAGAWDALAAGLAPTRHV
ncbi:AMP-binding protein [Streptomyces rhizosphaericus]